MDSNFVESALRATPHRVGGTDLSLNTTQAEAEDSYRQQTNINHTDVVSKEKNALSRSGVALLEVVVYTTVLLTVV